MHSAPRNDVAAQRVAIQGELGSFSHEAALALLPASSIVPCPLSSDVFQRLAEGIVDAAVIPIENSLAGSVLEHYDLLLAHQVRIEKEHSLRVRHNLIAPPGVVFGSLREVYSHPIALDQCRGFFRSNPHLRAMPFYDTAGSVKHVVTQQQDASNGMAAVASRQAAQQYGGVLLAEGIEDNCENYTRFFLIRAAGEGSAKRAAGYSQEECTSGPAAEGQANKVSLCFAVHNRPGSLVEALQVFASHRINLTKLESRPVPGSPWHYIFYADYQVEQLEKADTALAELVPYCSMIKELGRYRAYTRERLSAAATAKAL